MAVDRIDPNNSTLLLRGGTVIDGTGAARRRADVLVEGDRIVAVSTDGQSLSEAGAQMVDATGRIVAPGFIDVHTHDDQLLLSAPQMLPKISQGVTTVVIGNCGISLAPLVHADAPPPLNLLGGPDKYVYPTMAAYVAALEKAMPAVNVAALVGHSTLRVATMDDPYRPATSAEQARMCELLREGMAAGATGLSSGVFYAPALLPISTSWRCSPESPVRPAACTPRISGRKWTRSSLRWTKRSAARNAATCRW